MAQAWRRFLDAGGTLLLDGGTGTELRRRGYALRHDVWSALAAETHYGQLRAIHSAYIAAGADVITTNTFATTRFVLEAAGQAERFEIVNARAVAAALEARDMSGRDIAIAGSLSCLPPRFDVHAYPDERTESEAYLELAQTLAKGGVDLLVLEMMQETRHAPLMCAAAATVGLPVWLGVSCRSGAGGTLVGYDFPLVPLATCLETLLPFAPSAVCVMHTPVAAVLPALRQIRERWPGTIGAYPEIGDGTEATHAIAPADLAVHAREWIDAGARIVGGCCGTRPEHVRALAAVRASLRR